MIIKFPSSNGLSSAPIPSGELVSMRKRIAEIMEIADRRGDPKITYHAMALDFAISDALAQTNQRSD